MNNQDAHALCRLAQSDDFAVFMLFLEELEQGSKAVLMVNEHEVELRRQQGECRRHRKMLSLLEAAEAIVKGG
ncbi:hypothetical protein [Thiothrix winogradskyi]|uniref:Uncharacterized protein n=1 Tax=Thiothrix winogradskyi TaxID=96472 RepID=A0ABY3T353_9GAMM|nr:hypothetical protein [Thiothrix winogradskyi]UJS26278.1 hypothetical protein L2Y54_09625 [Thiothrix winogradskyi]